MTARSTLPPHPYELRLTLGADTVEDLVHRFEEIVFLLAVHREAMEAGDPVDVVSGGGGGSFSLTVRKSNTTTEEYREALRQWVGDRRSKR